jgi:signal transduction histidine kinase
MNPRNLQFRLTLWFAASVVAVVALFATVTYLHLRHELQYEQWARAHPENPNFILHGSYSKEEIDDIVGHILHISLLISLPLAFGALWLGRSFARKSLHPIATINAQLQAIGAANLNARILTNNADVELEAITQNINSLLKRIEAGYLEISEFSAQVAHELRTPLTLMRLQLEDASTQIDPDLSEGLQEELQRLESYVDQCLLIARAERGQLPTETESISLSALVENIIEPFTLLAREEARDLFCEYHFEGQTKCVPWIIRQILHNFLSNALKHGTGAITVHVTRQPGATSVSVGNSLGTQKTNGTGLGLRIVDALTHCQDNLRHENERHSGHYRAILIIED